MEKKEQSIWPYDIIDMAHDLGQNRIHWVHHTQMHTHSNQMAFVLKMTKFYSCDLFRLSSMDEISDLDRFLCDTWLIVRIN